MDAVDIHKIRPNINYHKFHDCMLVVVQRVMYRIFLWLYTGGSSYVGDYLKATERGMKLINAKERATLEEKKTAGLFDITLLYKVIQHTSNLADDRADVWHKPATSSEKESLEHTLFILKQERNSLSHEPQNYMHMLESELETKLAELRRLCTVALQKAGEKCNRTDKLSVDIERMLMEMKEIEDKPIPSGFTPEKLAAVAAHEIRSKQQALPSSSRTYVPPQVQLSRPLTDEVTSLSQLLSWRCENGVAPAVICVSGDTGTGKTSLCQHVFDSWVSANGKVSDLQECDLVIPIHCCDVCTRDLVRQLDRLLEDTIASCGSYEFLKLLKSLRILWLVDGYDEATEEALGLLKFLCKERGPAHTILVTSRPQDSHTLRNRIPPGEKVCDVILSGLTGDGAKELIDALFQENADGSEDWVEAVRDFRSTLDQLGDEVNYELQNPLKLTLAVKLWKKGTLNIEKGGTLTQWYAAIQQMHTENLCSKIGVNSSLNKESISRKVRKWLKKLHEVAFQMTLGGQYIHIGKPFQKSLEDESDRLQLPSETCLSTLLVCRSRGTRPTGEDGSYTFIHQSQQFYLAAQHMYLLISESSDGADILQDIIKAKISHGRTGQLVQFQPVLLYVLSTIVAQDSMQQPTADATDQLGHTVKVLVQLLSLYDRCDWLEVVQHAAYDHLVVREVSIVIPANWTVNNHRARAASALMEFTTPQHIQLDIHLATEKVQELFNLLNMIAMRPCDVSLSMMCLQFHDCVLDVLCGPSAVCNVVVFHGCLSFEGCCHLTRMEKVHVLALAITTQAVLEKVMVEVGRLPMSNGLQLFLIIEDISPPKVDSLPPHISLCIFLKRLDNISKAVRVISKISCKYDIINVPSIKSDRALKFVEKLQRKKVQVKSLHRSFTLDIPYFRGEFNLPYGPIPLKYPLHHFSLLWDDPPLSFSLRGGQLEILYDAHRLTNWTRGAGKTR